MQISSKIIVGLVIAMMTFNVPLSAQCPGCVTNMNFIISPAAPAINPDTLPDGEAGQYYNEDLNFYLPAQFTHSSGTNVTLNKLEVLSVSGLPFGLNFQSSSSSNTFFPSQNPPTTEHGCAKICGTPVFPGNYNMVVFVRAYVNTIIGNQTSDDSFVIPIKILPGSSGSASFSITNATGCGSVTASFETNLHSNGLSGYSYTWNFGNGLTSTAENPPAMTYSTPGQYNVSCHTVIDTLPFNYLNSVTVLGTSCTDFLGTPDIYIKVKNQSDTVLHQTAIVLDTDPPVNFTLPGIQLYHNQNYTIEVWDEDGGLAGADDFCKAFQIAGTSTSTSLWSGSDGISFVTSRPVLTYDDTLTVTVYPQPPVPTVTPVPTANTCAGDSILLNASAAANYQWYNDTALLMGAVSQTLMVFNSGKYFLVITDNNGCQAQSDTTYVNFYANPPKPTFWRQGDTLKTLLSGFNLQWYFNSNPINGATGQTCLITATGLYSLVATSTQGCSTPSDQVYYQPFNNAIEEFSLISDFVLYPNPNKGHFNLGFSITQIADVTVCVRNVLGQLLFYETIPGFIGLYQKEIQLDLPAALYFVDIKLNGIVVRCEKLIVN
ncbi:MAG: hypothetical protein BWY70_00614 [Bacteroidetes bacterium ADurb.Bin408]|nr:MAG: hypothetical protein BWY70_00614 [Bacteroidetes bacterium ADurb.Bin408]